MSPLAKDCTTQFSWGMWRVERDVLQQEELNKKSMQNRLSLHSHEKSPYFCYLFNRELNLAQMWEQMQLEPISQQAEVVHHSGKDQTKARSVLLCLPARSIGSALSKAAQPPTDTHAPRISQHSQRERSCNRGAETLCTYVSEWYTSPVASVYYYEFY